MASRVRKYGPEYYEARPEALLRDDHTCQVCGYEGPKLHVHHIDGDKTNHDLENLVTLCAGCHAGIHKGYDAGGKVLVRRAIGSGNKTLPDMIDATGLSESTVRKYLEHLVVAGAVENIGGGVYEFKHDPREEDDATD